MLAQFAKVALSVFVVRGVAKLFQVRAASQRAYVRAENLWTHGHDERVYTASNGAAWRPAGNETRFRVLGQRLATQEVLVAANGKPEARLIRRLLRRDIGAPRAVPLLQPERVDRAIPGRDEVVRDLLVAGIRRWRAPAVRSARKAPDGPRWQ